MSNAIKLTPAQAEALTHRLEVPEAIWESVASHEMQERYPDGPHVFFCDVCDILSDKVRSCNLSNLDDLERVILVDCIEGSTLVGIAMEERDFGRKPAQYVAQTRNVLRRLAQKFAGFQAQAIHVPSC